MNTQMRPINILSWFTIAVFMVTGLLGSEVLGLNCGSAHTLYQNSELYERKLCSVMAKSSSVHQGDTILGGNSVTLIEGRFDSNGSIIIENNASLILKNALLNFTQTINNQHNITLRNPTDGNPRLVAENLTLTASNLNFSISLYGNATAALAQSRTEYINHPIMFLTFDNSTLSMTDLSYADAVSAYDSSVVCASSSIIRDLLSYGFSEVQIADSEIIRFGIGSATANCTIAGLIMGKNVSWNFITDCAVALANGGSAPNITLTNTTIRNWRFFFFGSSNATITTSVIRDLSVCDYSTVCAVDCYLNIYMSASQYSTISLVNTTISPISFQLSIYDYAFVKVAWFIDAKVTDLSDQGVASASVAAIFPNGTVAESELTDSNGSAKLTLMEKLMNSTGPYSVGNYTIKAEYDSHSNETLVDIGRKSQAVTLKLDFVVPEFESVLLSVAFSVSAFIAVVFGRKTRRRLCIPQH